MNRTQRLLATLRQEIRVRGIKYQELGDKLSLSLPTIKRFFSSTNDVSLERLERMCVAAGIDLYDLMEKARAEQAEATLTETQEELLTDPKLLAIFFSAARRLNRRQIKSYCKFSDKELDDALRVLETHDLVERHPYGRLRSRHVFFSLRWIPGGPLERRYNKSFGEAFFKEAFDGTEGFSGFRQIYLTRASLETLSLKMRDLFNDAIAMSKTDLRSELTEVLSVGVLLSAQTWIPEIVRNFYHPDEDCASRLRQQLFES